MAGYKQDYFHKLIKLTLIKLTLQTVLLIQSVDTDLQETGGAGILFTELIETWTAKKALEM